MTDHCLILAWAVSIFLGLNLGAAIFFPLWLYGRISRGSRISHRLAAVERRLGLGRVAL